MKREEMLMYPDEYRVMFELEDTHWWYRGVRVLLRSWLARYAPADASRARILDAGCGTGANLQLLQAYGRAIGVDISEQAIAFCRARGFPGDGAFAASLTALPFPDQFFDLAVSLDVICNIADDEKAFVEVARVLKVGGRMIVQMPAYQWLWSMHDVAVGHQRRYDARDVREKISSAGLEIERVTHANALSLPFAAALRLARRRELNNNRAVHSDLTPLPNWVNVPLGALFAMEMHAVSRVDLPVGLSVIAVAVKR